MKKLSFKDAAFKVLNSAKEPLTAKEITDLAVKQGLFQTTGLTPEATMGAQLYLDINNNKSSRFKKIGRGRFALIKLNESTTTPLLAIENQNNLVKNTLIKKLHEMDPFQFEYLVAELLRKIGYEDVAVTKRSGDKGIDVVAVLTVGGLTDVKTVIQAKRYKKGNNISGKYITQLRGSAEVDQRGLIITTSDFTKDAIEESKAKNKISVALVNGEKLVELLFKYDVGVKTETINIYSFNNELFENDIIEDSLGSTGGKNKSIWPLPGGTHSYIDTLNAFLLHLSKTKNSTKKDLINWFISSFDNVASEKTAYGYIGVPKSMRLITVSNGKYFLTEDGEAYIKSMDNDFLFNIISKNILAFEEIYQLLYNNSASMKEQEIKEYIVENFDVEWSTNAQTNFRLIWLMNLGKIKKIDGGYICN